MESGSQTRIDPVKAAIYHGVENEKNTIPAAGGPADSPFPADASPAPDQATQITDAVRLAYCQPYVQAYFNFQLWDEADLAGWQSAPFWVDRTPKPSYNAFKRVIQEATSGAVNCENLKDSSKEATQPGAPGVDVAALIWPKDRSVDPENKLWRFRVRTAEDAMHQSVLYRRSGSRRVPVLRSRGSLRRGYLGFVRFPSRRLVPGLYQMQTMLVSADSRRRTTTMAGPVFRIQPPRNRRR